MSAPEATVKVDTLRLYPGQTITLYLHPKPSHYRADGENPGRQVEARVLEDGTAQVFAETDALSFERWTTQDTESARLAAEGWSWREQDLDSSRRRNAELHAQIVAMKAAHGEALAAKAGEVRNLLGYNTTLRVRIESLKRTITELERRS